MRQATIRKLLESFLELEKAINSARGVLEKKLDPPNEILERISAYEEILEKQRSLATALCDHLSANNWEEVARHITLINGLSAMIRDDAREILSGVQRPLSVEEKEILLS